MWEGPLRPDPRRSRYPSGHKGPSHIWAQKAHIAAPSFNAYQLLPMKPGAKLWGRETWALLRPGPFRRYLIGASISDTGTWMQIMAQGWVMSTLTNKAIMLGMVNFAAGLPMIFLTMFGGSIADRLDKRKILIWTQVVQIALAVAIGFLILAGRIQIWHIIVGAGLLGVAFAFEHPALSALVPELVKQEEIAAAVALDRGVFHCARLVGPSVAGIVVAVWGAATAFFTNAFSFLAFVVALLSLPPRPVGSKEEEAQRSSGFKEGIRYVRADKPSLAMVGMIAAMTIFIFPTVSVMMPLYVRDVLHFGPAFLGYLMAASAGGSVFGAIALVSIPRPRRLAGMMASALAVMAAGLALSGANLFSFAAAALVVISFGLSLIFGLSNTIVQERAPAYLRGRVSAVMGLSFFGLMPVAGLGVTSLADAIGMRTALAVSAICYGVAAVFILSRIGSALNETPVTTASPAEPEVVPAL
ncbi:MFS transporter [soil metagenome]